MIITICWLNFPKETGYKLYRLTNDQQYTDINYKNSLFKRSFVFSKIIKQRTDTNDLGYDRLHPKKDMKNVRKSAVRNSILQQAFTFVKRGQKLYFWHQFLQSFNHGSFSGQTSFSIPDLNNIISVSDANANTTNLITCTNKISTFYLFKM